MYDPCDPRGLRTERRHPEHAYSVAWFTHAFIDPPMAPKFGLALVLAVLVDGYHVFFTRVFAGTLLLWGVDMIVGMSRALADPNVRFRWPKMMDGLLRLLVMSAVALALAILEGALSEATGTDVRGKLISVAYAIFIVAEGTSILTNAAYFYPRLGSLEAVLIKILPSGRPVVEDATLVVKVKESTPSKEDDR